MPVKDETGKKYGRLQVLYRVENNARGDAQWKCLCECGKEVIVKGTHLRSGKTKSCGCLQKDKVRQTGYNNTSDLVGKQFGKLIVEERVIGNKEKIGKWKCLCDCGGITFTTSDKLLSGHTNSCGCLQSKGEMKIAEILKNNNINFKKEFSFSDLKRKYILRFDFAIFDNRDNLFCLIEFDGSQHYDKTNAFYSIELSENDTMKNNYCLLNGIKLYRIRYDDNIEDEIKKILDNFKAKN